MWQTLLSAGDQQKNMPSGPPKATSHNSIATSMSTQETANVISDSLIVYVEKALASTPHKTKTDTVENSEGK